MSVLLLCLPSVLAFWLLRKRRGALRLVLLLGHAGLVLGAPWWVPADDLVMRFFAAVLAAFTTMRVWEYAWDRYPEPSLQGTLPGFLLTLFSVDQRWPTSSAGRARVRRSGLRLIARGGLQLLGFLALLGVASVWPRLQTVPGLAQLWLCLVTGSLIPGAFDVLVGCGRQTGLDGAEGFKLPLLARSPRDFWSKRWNRAFHLVVLRLVFQSLPRRRQRFWGTLGGFLFSALVHEYLVVMTFRTTDLSWLAFFLLHGVAVLVYGEARARHGFRRFLPPFWGVLCHSLWMVLSAPLFFPHLLRILPVDTWTLW